MSLFAMYPRKKDFLYIPSGKVETCGKNSVSSNNFA